MTGEVTKVPFADSCIYSLPLAIITLVVSLPLWPLLFTLSPFSSWWGCQGVISQKLEVACGYTNMHYEIWWSKKDWVSLDLNRSVQIKLSNGAWDLGPRLVITELNSI